MATYYIDGESATNGAGTYTDPYNVTPTITSSNTYLYAAGHTLNGGASTAINVPASATDVTIGAYDPATGTRLTSGSRKAYITVDSAQFTVRVNTNAHRCTIEMLDVTNLSGVSQAHGIYIGNTSSLVATDCVVRRCVVHDISGTSTANGIAFRGSGFTAYENVIYGIPADGIFGYGNNVRIYQNTIYGVDQLSSSGDCIQLAGDATLGCSNVQIWGNSLTNQQGNKQCVIVQDTTGGSAGGFISQNRCVIARGASNQAIYVESNSVEIASNRCSGGYYGIFVKANACKLLGNLVYDVVTGINLATGASAGNLLYGNTVIGATGYGLYLADDTAAIAKNNLLVSNAIGLAKHGSATEDYNWYYDNTTDQANVAGTPAWGSNNVTVDPQIDGNYAPATAQAGTRIADVVLRDFYGKEIVDVPDIGAIQVYAARSVSAARGTSAARAAVTRNPVTDRAPYG